MKFCSVEKCNNKHLAKGFCKKHYRQMQTHGKILQRSKHDLNEVWFKDNLCFMKLYNRKQKWISTTVIDKEDYEKVKEYRWCKHTTGYVQAIKDGKRYRMHKIICEGDIIDHINRKKRDNRKVNLRSCTKQQNCCNKKNYTNNKSGIAGVSFRSRGSIYEAYITVNYKQIYVGGSKNINIASKLRKDAEQKYFGNFAPSY